MEQMTRRMVGCYSFLLMSPNLSTATADLNLTDSQEADMRILKEYDWLLDLNNSLALITALTANLSLIYLLFQPSFEEIRAFRVIVSIQAVLELLDALLLYIAKVRYYEVPEYGLITVVTGIAQHFPRWVVAALCALNENFAYLVIAYLPVQFLYRYWVLSMKTDILRAYQKILIVCIMLGLIAVAPLDSYIAFAQISISNSETIPHLGLHLKNQSVPGLTKYAQILMFAIPTTTSYMIVIYCILKTFRLIAQNATSAVTKQLQWQVTMVMSLQATLPIIFQTAPTAALYCEALTRHPTALVTKLYMICTPWEKCIHPLLCLVFIKPIRRGLAKRLLCCCSCCKPITSVHPADRVPPFSTPHVDLSREKNFSQKKAFSMRGK